MTFARAAAIAAAAVVFLGAASARAGDPASAQALFDQGKKLMAQEKWTEACAKLEESQRLDPAGGTLLHLALCREHEGRIATAWALYQDALAQAKQDARKDRAKVAQERIDALAPRLPRMRVKVAAQNQKVDGFKLLRDDVVVGQPMWGESLPVDPGPRTLTARAPGKKTWTARIEVPARAEEIVVEVPQLDDEPRPDIAHGAEPPAASRLEEAKRGETQRAVGIAAGGAGVIGLAIGTVFGIVSISKASEADDKCAPPDRKLCTPEGKEAGDDALSAGNASTVAFIAGGVLLAGGVALYFTAPSGGTSTGLAIGPGRIGFRATF